MHVYSRPIPAIGVGKQDYSLNVASATVPTSRGRLYRTVTYDLMSLPGPTYCNQFIPDGPFPFIDWDGRMIFTAPTAIYHYFDCWAEINSTKPLYFHFCEYATIKDCIADNILRDLGGSWGLGSVELKWTAGVSLVPGRAYALRFKVVDAGLTDFTIWLGIAGIKDENVGR